MATAYLGLGSNVGDLRGTIERAIGKLRTLGSVGAISSLYKTEPIGFADQPWFLNCTLVLETKLLPVELLGAIKRIEKELGRTPAARNAPREIDIDILLYDDLVVATDSLTIPHPRMHERRFVLAPLSEVAPQVMHPLFGKSMQELLAGLSDSHAVKRLDSWG